MNCLRFQSVFVGIVALCWWSIALSDDNLASNSQVADTSAAVHAIVAKPNFGLEPLSGSSGAPVIVVGLSLLFIIVLIYAGAWYIRRVQNFAFSKANNLRIVSALSVGARERVILVQVGTQQLLLGVAPGSVNVLKSYDQPAIEVDAQAEYGGFSKVLKNAVKKATNQN